MAAFSDKKMEEYNKSDPKESISIEMKEVSTKKKKDDDDVWEINYEENDDREKFKEMSSNEQIKFVIFTIIKIILVLGFLYLFICSISMLGDAFQILSGKSAGEIFSNDSFLGNPISGLILGILVTVLVQSSSTSTSIVTTMVAASILDVQTAIPIIMGANIGTSVTNTIVSLSQSMSKEQFRKAFAGATLLDVFNILSVLVFLTLEIITGYLYYMTKAIIDSFNIQQGADAPDLLKVITDPLVKGIVRVNKTIITLVAQGVPLEPEASMIYIWCETTDGTLNKTEAYNQTVSVTSTAGDVQPVTDVIQATTFIQETVQVGVRKCKSPDDFLFANTGLTDVEAGLILLFVSLIIMTICLVLMVKTLSSLLQGSVAVIIKKVINSNFKFPFGWVTGYLAIIVGAGLTFLVQSSSVFTSTITPLVGMGVISLKRMYPLTLGANIGTTTTSILAALASDGSQLIHSLQISLVHLFFNLSGIILFYPIPFMRDIPIKAAKFLGNTTATYKWFAVLYIIMVFFVIPVALLGLSVASEWAVTAVVVFVVVLALFITIVNVLQNRKPSFLPMVLRTWEFLPTWMRSLQPYDKFMTKFLLCCCKEKTSEEDEETVPSGSSEDIPSVSGNSMSKSYLARETKTDEAYSTNMAYIGDEGSLEEKTAL